MKKYTRSKVILFSLGICVFLSLLGAISQLSLDNSVVNDNSIESDRYDPRGFKNPKTSAYTSFQEIWIDDGGASGNYT